MILPETSHIYAQNVVSDCMSCRIIRNDYGKVIASKMGRVPYYF